MEEDVVEYSPAGRVKRKASKKVRYREYEDDDSMSFDLDKIMQEVEEQQRRYCNRQKNRSKLINLQLRSYHIETSKSIYFTNLLIGFYLMKTLALTHFSPVLHLHN